MNEAMSEESKTDILFTVLIAGIIVACWYISGFVCGVATCMMPSLSIMQQRNLAAQFMFEIVGTTFIIIVIFLHSWGYL